MNPLFSKDAILETNKLAEELRSYCTVHQRLQEKIRMYANLKAYQNYFLKDKYRDYIVELYKKFSRYLDISETSFIPSFKSEFGPYVFNLTMANFLNERFVLQERSNEERENKKQEEENIPDLKFVFNNKLYFLECTTRYTSLIDKFLENISFFDLYFKLAKTFAASFEKKVKGKYSGLTVSWYQEGFMDETFREMDRKEKSTVEKLMQELGIEGISALINKINEWLEFHLDLYFQFEDIIPIKIAKKLKKIIPTPFTTNTLYGDECLGFLIKCLAVKVLEKLDKSYFKEKKPVILAISLSILPNGMKQHTAMNRATGLDISQLLLTELNNIINSGKYTKEKIQELSENIKYLYAILIDSIWYNWFPPIVEEEEDAKFLEGYKNCYRIIYNQNLAQDVDFDHDIFDSLISPKYTNFSSFVLEQDSAELIKT